VKARVPRVSQTQASQERSDQEKPAAQPPVRRAPRKRAAAPSKPNTEGPTEVANAGVGSHLVEAAVVEAAVVEAAVVEAAVVEASVVDAPAVEASALDAPVVDPPAVESPSVEPPAVERPDDEAPVVLLPLIEPPVEVPERSLPNESPASVASEPLAVSESALEEPTAPAVPDESGSPIVLSITGLVKRFGEITAVDGVALDVRAGSFYGIVGPNGAGKTTTLSMVTGLLRPDHGTIIVHGVNVWTHPARAKRSIGVLPDRLRLFDRLTGAQLLYYSGTLRGLDTETVRERSADLAEAFGLEDALNRLVADYSAGMTKKVALAAAMIHSPRLLVLDEPFESVDPVSAANVIEILQRYVASGGTVVLSSHGMDLIQRVCDSVAIIVQGKVLASGTVEEVRGGQTLENRFVELAGGRKAAEGMEWLHSFSD
jgi:ABC-type multidrug transport system ATPase subunit